MHDDLTTLRAGHLAGETGGLLAVCSAHPAVIREAALLAAEKGAPLLVEATANQVNQEGGYSGMTPEAFAALVRENGRRAGLAGDRVMVGADHLGPGAWGAEPSEKAMDRAAELARRCVRAGFAKIHLDTGRPCADDPKSGVPAESCARRAAALCRVAEAAVGPGGRPPVYVIGDEVPPPGGGLKEGFGPAASSPDTVRAALRNHQAAFFEAGLERAWARVAAIVVQPGVEFGDWSVAAYRKGAAQALSRLHAELPEQMTFEVHSADYQTPTALGRMVQDHFLFLKIGPCLTFAYRQALYALADIEAEMPDIPVRSDLRQVMEDLMARAPEHWRTHYRGTEAVQRFLRHYSLRDRIRYYWPLPSARRAVKRLFENLRREVPAALVAQFLPDFGPAAAQSPVPLEPEQVASRRIREALGPLVDAVFRPAQDDSVSPVRSRS